MADSFDRCMRSIERGGIVTGEKLEPEVGVIESLGAYESLPRE